MIRVSYTLINLWEQGKRDEMVAYYMGVKKEPTAPMQKGKDYDSYITDFVQANSRLPDSLGGILLDSPINQVKMEYVDAKNDIKFVFVPDLIDSKILYEFKTGTTDLNQYLYSMQIPSYLYLLDKVGIEIDRAYLINEKQGWYLISNNDEIKEKARCWLYDYAIDIREWFIELGLE